ncbi:MAG: general stress protein [Bacillus sp. (in: Bacteria)]|nr:general stress protein [Bacillus sp. (in: firmicutes)]
MKQVKIVRNDVEAKKTVELFFTKNEVFLIAHDKNRSNDLTDATDTNEILPTEIGVIESLVDVFLSRGDELRSNMEYLGFSYFEAQHFEGELDLGRIDVVATKKVS